MKKLCSILVMFVCAFGTTTVFAGRIDSSGLDTEEKCLYHRETSCSGFDIRNGGGDYQDLKANTKSGGYTERCFQRCDQGSETRSGESCTNDYHLIIVNVDGCKQGYTRKKVGSVDLVLDCSRPGNMPLYKCEEDCTPSYNWVSLPNYTGIEKGTKTNSCDSGASTVYRCAPNYTPEGKIVNDVKDLTCTCRLSATKTDWESYAPGIEQKVTTDGCGASWETGEYRCAPNYTPEGKIVNDVKDLTCECSLPEETIIDWESYDPDPGIEQKVTTDGCGDRESYKYRCAKGYFSQSGKAESGNINDLGCVSCADQTGVTGATTRSEASISIQACYVPKDTTGSDSTGYYEFTEDCDWKSN